MHKQFVIAILWLAGFGLSYWMLKAEHEAEKEAWTNGDKAVQVALSMLSFLTVLILLFKAWAAQVGPYWDKQIPGKRSPEVKHEDRI